MSVLKGFTFSKLPVVKIIWPWPEIVFCYIYDEVEYDEPLKIYKFGLLDYSFELKGKKLNVWVEKG